VVTSQDENEMKYVLEQALIVIDERNFERSLRDPRVHALRERRQAAGRTGGRMR
jgi:hypothetical protein